jgi:Pyruvate/2-oxoacid:ferredoxin oxidoreductase delta subunit
MKAVLHFFSGTGNTARAVAILAARLEAAGWDVARAAIAGGVEPPAGIPDLTAVAFPIWAWAPPQFVLEYVRRLPEGQGAPAAVLATCGAFGAQGVGEMERALRRRGYDVVASGEAVYPDNFLLAVDPPTGIPLDEVLAAGDETTMVFATTIVLGAPTRMACAWGHVLWSWPVARLFRICGRRFLGKFFVADDRCTSCGQCAVACPVQAIRMAGAPARPRWGANCAGCYRCIHLCPAQAIQVSMARLAIHLGVNLALAVGWVGAIGGLRERWAALGGGAAWGLAIATATAAFAALMVLQLTALDGLLREFETRPALRRFFAASYTTSFGRYRAPGFRPENNGVLSR